MREHPDYKYRPRRKPKPMMKKELTRYPFPFPFLPGLDPLSRQLISSYSIANQERGKEHFSSPLDLSSFKLGQPEENFHLGMMMKSQSFLANPSISSFSTSLSSSLSYSLPPHTRQHFSSVKHVLPSSLYSLKGLQVPGEVGSGWQGSPPTKPITQRFSKPSWFYNQSCSFN